MPEMNGIELLRRIHAKGILPGVKIIIMSGKDNFQRLAYEGGADFFLIKPFEIKFLYELIQKLMES